MSRDELSEGGRVEREAGVDEGSVRGRRSVLPATAEGSLPRECSDEIEGVENEEGGELFGSSRGQLPLRLRSAHRLTSKTFNRAVGLSLLAFCPGAVPVASLTTFSLKVSLISSSSSSDPEPFSSSSAVGSSRSLARSADESVRWRWRMTLMRWICESAPHQLRSFSEGKAPHLDHDSEDGDVESDQH